VATAIIAAAASLAILGVALLAPWLADARRVPSEWLTLGGWTVLGAAVWLASARSRGSVSEAERGVLLRGGMRGEPRAAAADFASG
jgi:hypothetical protein